MNGKENPAEGQEQKEMPITADAKKYAKKFAANIKNVFLANLLHLVVFLPCAALACGAVLLLLNAFGYSLANITEIETGHFMLVLAAAICCMLPSSVTWNAQTYVVRNIAQDKPVELKGDFLKGIKEGWKQSLCITAVLGAAGAIVLPLVVRCYLGTLENGLFYLPLILLAIFLLLLYLGSHITYIMLASFNLEFKHLVLNTLLIAIAKLPQGIICTFFEVLALSLCFGWIYFTRQVYALPLAIGIIVFALVCLPIICFIKSNLGWDLLEELLAHGEETMKQAEEAAYRAAEAQATAAHALDENDDDEYEDEEEEEDDDEDDDNTPQTPRRSTDIENGDELVFYNGRMVRRDEIEFL